MIRDYISIKKIWQDDEFYQVQMLFENDLLKVSTKVYVCDDHIRLLQKGINSILENEKKTFSWKTGERGNESTPCVEFHIFQEDNRGHFVIEVFLELDDGGDLNTHNCCFYIQTEYGLLQQFSSDLDQLKETVLGQDVLLSSKIRG